jgi:hypothetical protein
MHPYFCATQRYWQENPLDLSSAPARDFVGDMVSKTVNSHLDKDQGNGVSS